MQLSLNMQFYHSRHFFYFRVTVELARGTPHGRDRERWGDGRGGGRYDRGGRGDRDR